MNLKIEIQDREILAIIMELSKAVRCCRHDEVFCEDVTFTQFIILDTIAKDQSLNMASLHDILSVDKSTTTRLIAPLIKRGLIIREKADHDYRAAILKLTKQGKDTHEKVWQCLVSFIRAIRTELPDEKREAALEGIRIFLSTLQNVSATRCAEYAGQGSCTCAAIV